MVHIVFAQEYNDAFSSVKYTDMKVKNKHSLLELFSTHMHIIWKFGCSVRLRKTHLHSKEEDDSQSKTQNLPLLFQNFQAFS